MKKIIIPFILMLAFLVSCENNEYETPFGDFSSFKWYTSTDTQDANYVIALEKFIAFRDVSQNTVSHTWSIPTGTSLLNSKFTDKDSIYTSFISENGALNTEEKLINVLFREPGIKEIKLQNVFKDSVTNAVLVGGKWKVDQIFTIEVFDNIKPAFKVMNGNIEVLNITANDMVNAANSASWQKVSIEAGSQLTYIDVTTVGKSDSRTWSFNGGNIDMSGSESAKVLYNSLGNYTAGSILSKRDIPKGQVTKLIPLNIEVIPSTKPFVITNVLKENASEIISFNVSGEIANIANEEANFTVTVMNSVSGFNQDIPVESVSINNSDATQIDLVLSAPIFNSDDIMISYNAGNIVSVDSRVLESFGTKPVEMFFEGVLNPETLGYEIPWSGVGNQFKLANTEGYVGVHNADNAAGPVYYFRDESKAFDGNSSMKFETPDTGIPNNARLRAFSFVDLNGGSIPANTYLPVVWVFMEAGNTMTTMQYNFQRGPVLNFDISTATRGEWVRVELPLEVSSGVDSGRIDINIRNTGQNDAQVQKMWIDKFDLLIVEPRT
jgi:hypothetical protein